jgi:hypothetical protein
MQLRSRHASYQFLANLAEIRASPAEPPRTNPVDPTEVDRQLACVRSMNEYLADGGPGGGDLTKAMEVVLVSLQVTEPLRTHPKSLRRLAFSQRSSNRTGTRKDLMLSAQANTYR